MTKLLSDLEKATLLGSPLHHDVQWVGSKVKQLCLSWSKIEKFQQCPRLFNATYIENKFPFDATNPILQWGNKVHKDMENYLLKGMPFPVETKKFKPTADAVKRQVTKLEASKTLRVPLNGEQEWAITANGKYASWFDSPNVFMRGKADLMFGSTKSLYAYDWKTGAGKYPKPEQLELITLIAKGQPKLQNYEVCKSALIFLESEKAVPLTVRVDPPNHEAIMRKYLSIGIEIVEAYEEGEWAMKQSGLCGWCDEVTCPYNTKE